jgi:hypothetical protein
MNLKKSTAIVSIIAALLLGVAVTVYAQITWATVSVKYDATTTYPALDGKTEWAYVWQKERQMQGKSTALADCDAACRRLTVGTAMLAAYKERLAQRIREEQIDDVNSNAAQILAALNGTVE